ncbi:hypothetical protein AB1Y20_018271 [Prymnesium parvum]|uniref:RGS domain-containing protein n=1 Tax=Prymnesium parvum TaxID=97485 RepID=A0AB34JPF9_PRYPA
MSAPDGELKQQLDATIRQRLNMSFVDGDQSRMSALFQSGPQLTVDVSNFARFLSHNLCIEVLLFWKDVEQYKTLFSPKERAAVGSKIFETYIKEGCVRKVNVNAAEVQKIEEQAKAGQYSEDVFDEAQNQMYQMMLLDLFPRYSEEMAAKQSGSAGQQEKVASSLKEVLSGTNLPAQRHFARFSKENYLEESLLFWLDVNDFTLLFQKSDLHSSAKRIYETYMGPMAKQKVNVSDAQCDEIKAIVETPVSEVSINSQLFAKAQKEIETFLELDVWDRYVQWCEGDGKIGTARPTLTAKSSSAFLLSENNLGDRDKMREAVVELLTITHEIENLKALAKDRECEEAIEFYLDVKDFQKLFSSKDLVEAANRIWARYLDDKADRMVNLPASIHKVLKKEIVDNSCKNVSLNTFDKANREMIQLITDNVYPAWVHKYKRSSQSRSVDDGRPASTYELPPPPATSGSCCVIA